MSQEEAWTVKRLLEWTGDFFKKKGIESPRLEAEILLADSLGLKRIELYTNYDSVPDDEKRTKFREFVKRRGAGEPVAYLVAYKEFFSLKFKVDSRVLIPRPETEQAVLSVLDLLKKFPSGSKVSVCDVGTGSGAIAISVAKNAPKTLGSLNIVALDISKDALELARENAESLLGSSHTVKFIESDLLEQTEKPFDIIVSNPPYVSESEYEVLPDDVKRFEPKSALLAPEEGAGIIRRLIEQAENGKLKSGGCILVEFSPMIADRVSGMFGKSWTDVKILKDTAGMKRMIFARKT